eukprot:NODE_1404_length_1550_cov_29.895403_g1265_i0.p1 GENE.NODE_1404_length_1550_cov_29.895403_g1265_i0~~NODE_1404_length_1550_cov_29.895403_g1265_i0.p1  ORF type:complete len:422 (+),score=40.58 NODE_1404_length_1550_cov_29.895403_g1265_i0:107-1372(+)
MSMRAPSALISAVLLTIGWLLSWTLVDATSSVTTSPSATSSTTRSTSFTPTRSATRSVTRSATATFSATGTATFVATHTVTGTFSPTLTRTGTRTISGSETDSLTFTPTSTVMATHTSSQSTTVSIIPTLSLLQATVSATQSSTSTATRTSEMRASFSFVFANGALSGGTQNVNRLITTAPIRLNVDCGTTTRWTEDFRTYRLLNFNSATPANTFDEVCGTFILLPNRNCAGNELQLSCGSRTSGKVRTQDVGAGLVDLQIRQNDDDDGSNEGLWGLMALLVIPLCICCLVLFWLVSRQKKGDPARAQYRQEDPDIEMPKYGYSGPPPALSYPVMAPSPMPAPQPTVYPTLAAPIMLPPSTPPVSNFAMLSNASGPNPSAQLLRPHDPSPRAGYNNTDALHQNSLNQTARSEFYPEIEYRS